MNRTGFVKCAGAIAALAASSACAGGSAVAPSNAAFDTHYVGRTLSVNGRLVTAARMNTSPQPRFATILPDHARRHKKFEYVINFYGSFATIFDYPKSNAMIGEINNVGGQGCTNKLHGYGKNTFWIVAGYNQITEYKVPQTPVKTLSVPDGSMPSSCAMNQNGDLAVGILSGPSTGDILLFKNATGTGQFIKTPIGEEFFDGYDNQGNLFFDGFTSQGLFQFDEIPNGTTTAKTITLPNAIQFPGSVQWDGSYVTVFDQGPDKMYRYTISGTKATLKDTITLSGAGDCAQTWIAKNVVYCGDAGDDNGSVFQYPEGGPPRAIFTGDFNEPLGTVAAERT